MRGYGWLMPIITRTPINGARLRELREAAELSQADLAAKCSRAGRPVNQSQISRLEAGRHQPYMPLLRTLAKVLGVAVEDLLDRQPAKQAS